MFNLVISAFESVKRYRASANPSAVNVLKSFTFKMSRENNQLQIEHNFRGGCYDFTQVINAVVK